jgi:hypothetical protein
MVWWSLRSKSVQSPFHHRIIVLLELTSYPNPLWALSASLRSGLPFPTPTSLLTRIISKHRMNKKERVSAGNRQIECKQQKERECEGGCGRPCQRQSKPMGGVCPEAEIRRAHHRSLPNLSITALAGPLCCKLGYDETGASINRAHDKSTCNL